MNIEKQSVSASGIKLFAMENGQIIGRAYLYILKNDLHPEPFGFMEDVFVEEQYRKHGIGKQLVEVLIAEAKIQGCYKLIGTSRSERPQVHEFYKKFGFQDYGKEFRMDLPKKQG